MNVCCLTRLIGSDLSTINFKRQSSNLSCFSLESFSLGVPKPAVILGCTSSLLSFVGRLGSSRCWWSAFRLNIRLVVFPVKYTNIKWFISQWNRMPICWLQPLSNSMIYIELLTGTNYLVKSSGLYESKGLREHVWPCLIKLRKLCAKPVKNRKYWIQSYRYIKGVSVYLSNQNTQFFFKV